MNQQQTRKSTTHNEKFFHFDLAHPDYKAATVFAREEAPGWNASVAFCSWDDNFCRKTGRNVARRHYFSKGKRYSVLEPNLEEIKKLVTQRSYELSYLPAAVFLRY